MMCHYNNPLLLLIILSTSIYNAKGLPRDRDMVEIAHSRLAVVASNNNTAPQYMVVGYEEAKKRDPVISSSMPKFRPDPLPGIGNIYPQLVRKNSSMNANYPKSELPPLPTRPIIEKNRPLIFEKSKFEIINEYLEERISNLTIKVHNSNFDCDSSEIIKLRKQNQELSYKNKILEAENILLQKMGNNNGSYVKIVSNQPLKPVHCFEIENKYRMCEANKNTLESNISNLLNMNKNFPPTFENLNNKNCTGQTEELRKCLLSVEQCFEESENMVRVLHECQTAANNHLDQLEELEKDVLRLNLDNKYVTQQILEINENYLKLKNFSTIFYNKIFDYAINIQEEGKYNESLNILNLILEARESILGPDDAEVITIEHEIAFVLNNHKIAKYKEAHQLFSKVLDKRRRLYGEDHPDTLLTLYNIADVMRNLKRNAYYYQDYIDSLETSQGFRDMNGDTKIKIAES